MKKRNEKLLKYVSRKYTPKERKAKNPVGTLWFQRRGLPTVKFDCQDPNDPEFMMEYALLLNGDKQRLMKQPRVRNMIAVIDSYTKSPRYIDLASNTAKDYDKVLAYLKKQFGDTKPQQWERHHMIKMRDDNQATWRFANYTVQVIRIVFEHAIDRGWLKYNPARGVAPLESRGDPRVPWPDQLINAYRDTAAGRALLVFELCLGTGQRIGDVLDFKWTDIRPIKDTVGIDLVQNKTKKLLWVPLPERLVTLLSNTKRQHEYILTAHRKTNQWSYRGASDAVMTIRRKIGAEKYDIHSLRYNAACELALAGLDDETIGAVTGQTEQTVKHYTKSVRQMANAKRAMDARERMLLENGT